MSDVPKILIVDDDELFAESNRDLLEAYGFDVFIAHDGASGLKLAHEVVPDIMILDVMMTTDTEGFEVARKIPESSELRRMSVLMVTGITHAMHLPEPLKPDKTWLPVDRVLEKPIPPDRLIREVKRLMAEKAEARKEDDAEDSVG